MTLDHPLATPPLWSCRAMGLLSLYPLDNLPARWTYIAHSSLHSFAINYIPAISRLRSPAVVVPFVGELIFYGFRLPLIDSHV